MKNRIRKIFTPIFFVSLALVGSKDRVWSQDSVRIATFNTSLNLCANNRTSPCLEGGLNQYLANGNYAPAQGVAEILQRIAPDIVLLNEFNFDSSGAAADLFQENFLSVGQNVSRHPDGAANPISYPYRYLAAVNTGVHSGWDLDNNGSVDDSVGDGSYAGDAFGFGEFPGRYGMLLLSKYPIDVEAVRTFQNFLWQDMSDSLLPTSWYSESEQDVLRLSSKSHWDVPIDVNGQTLHVLASHPTPPVFDGPEDRNGRRNHDEIRFWADYVTPGKSDYIVDDKNVSGGLSELASFVVLGDQNADPTNGDSVSGAIDQLLNAERVNGDFVPISANHGALTSSFNLRVDYVLPSNDLEVVDGAVFWPQSPDPLARLSLVSDHRLVWLDVQMVPEPNNTVWLMVVTVWTLRRSSTRRFGRNGSDEIVSGRS